MYYKQYTNSPARSTPLSPWRRTAQPPNSHANPPPWPVQNPSATYNNKTVRPPSGWDGTQNPRPEKPLQMKVKDITQSSFSLGTMSRIRGALHVDSAMIVDQDLNIRHNRPTTAQNKTAISRTMMNSSVLLSGARDVIKTPVGTRRRIYDTDISHGNRFFTRPSSASPTSAANLVNSIQWSTTSPCSMSIFH